MATKIEELTNEKLRKVSDTVYQEAERPSDRHRPLEWRKSLNSISLPLKDVEVVSNFNVQKIGFRFDDDRPWQQQIEPKIETARFISAHVNREKCRDFILCAEIDAGDEGITKLKMPSRETKLNLRAGTPTDGTDVFPSGIYWGRCFHFREEDRVDFDIYLPEAQLNDILECLARDPNLQIDVHVSLLSFDFEVDATLRDWYHPQYLFIEDHADVAVSFVKTSSCVGTLPDSPHKAIELTEGIRALRSLSIAIWVLIAVVVYSLVK